MKNETLKAIQKEIEAGNVNHALSMLTAFTSGVISNHNVEMARDIWEMNRFIVKNLKFDN